jgi:hypothetical protein
LFDNQIDEVVGNGIEAMAGARAPIKALVNKVDNFDSLGSLELKQACRDAHLRVTFECSKALLINRLRVVQQYCAPYFRDDGE